MTGKITHRLQELQLELPVVRKPVANFVACVQTGNLVFVSGQVTAWDGGYLYVGKVGDEISLPDAQEAAKICALNVIAQAQDFLGDLDRIARVVMVQGFVNATPTFMDHPKVINGASDVFVAVFGEAGRHARFALGAGSLPYNVAVEIAAVLEVNS